VDARDIARAPASYVSTDGRRTTCNRVIQFTVHISGVQHLIVFYVVDRHDVEQAVLGSDGITQFGVNAERKVKNGRIVKSVTVALRSYIPGVRKRDHIVDAAGRDGVPEVYSYDLRDWQLNIRKRGETKTERKNRRARQRRIIRGRAIRARALEQVARGERLMTGAPVPRGRRGQ